MLTIFQSLSKPNYDPREFQGKTDIYGGSANYKRVLGGGVNASIFTMQSGWMGLSIGLSGGIGLSHNRGSVFMGQSNSTLLNNVKKTRERTWFDRFTNKYFTTISSLAQYLSRQ